MQGNYFANERDQKYWSPKQIDKLTVIKNKMFHSNCTQSEGYREKIAAWLNNKDQSLITQSQDALETYLFNKKHQIGHV